MPRKQQAEQQADFEQWYLDTPVNLQLHPVGSTRYKLQLAAWKDGYRQMKSLTKNTQNHQLQLAAWKDGYRQAVTDIDTLNATEIR